MKQTVIIAFVMGFMLVAANGANAAYTGLYTNSNTGDSVFLGNGSFDWGGDTYAVTPGEVPLTWVANGANDMFFGATLGDRFAFIQAGTSFDPDSIPALAGAATAFATQAFTIVSTLGVNDPFGQFLLQQLVDDFTSNLPPLGLDNAAFGFGEFAPGGESFTVYSQTVLGFDGNVCSICPETYERSATPIPGAVWLLGSGLVGLVGLRRRKS